MNQKKEMSQNRREAIELMRHPLNRAFFEMVVRILKDDGIYGWPDRMETFTRAEIMEALADEKK
jgi:hypothetical protein